MKKILLVLLVLMPLVSFAQNDAAKKLTKFEQLSSKTGKISKFVDVNLPNIPLNFFWHS